MINLSKVDISIGAIIIGAISYFHTTFTSTYWEYDLWLPISTFVTGLEITLLLLVFYRFGLYPALKDKNKFDWIEGVFFIFTLYVLVYFSIYSYFSFSFIVKNQYLTMIDFESFEHEYIKSGVEALSIKAKFGTIILNVTQCAGLLIILYYFHETGPNLFNRQASKWATTLYDCLIIILAIGLVGYFPKYSFSFWTRYVNPITIKKEITLRLANDAQKWFPESENYIVKASLKGPVYSMRLRLFPLDEGLFESDFTKTHNTYNKEEDVLPYSKTRFVSIPLLPVFNMFTKEAPLQHQPFWQSVTGISLRGGGTISLFYLQPDTLYFIISKDILPNDKCVLLVEPGWSGKKSHIILTR